MRTQKLEALLSLLMFIGIPLSLLSFQPLTQEVAAKAISGMPVMKGVESVYELDAYETCTIVDKKPDSVCDKLMEKN